MPYPWICVRSYSAKTGAPIVLPPNLLKAAVFSDSIPVATSARQTADAFLCICSAAG